VVIPDFELTQEQKLLKQTAHEFSIKYFAPKVASEYEKKREFPWDLYRKMAEQGFIGMTWPPEYGGQGASFTEQVIAHYELIRYGDPSLTNAVIAGSFGSDMIAHFGTHEQKAKWLPRVAKGEITSAACFTEPAGGSDISRKLDTQAVKDGDYWIINGTKTFITNATTASFFITLAQTDLNVQPSYRGQTEFIIERQNGIETTAFEEKLGWLASPTGQVVFNNVKVRDDDILGGPQNLNRGFYMGLMFLDQARAAIGVIAVATAEQALEKAISYSKERKAFGKPIAGFQGLGFRLVEMATKIEAAKSLVWKSVKMVEKTREDLSFAEESVKLASMAKWYSARVAVEACDLLVDVMAGYGYVESDAERWYRFVKQLEIVEGTKEIQKNTIARIMLGREILRAY